MKLAFATLGCPDWTLEQIAANARDMGFDGVELRGAAGQHIGPEEPAEQRRVIRRLFEKTGVEIVGIMGYSGFTADDPAKRGQDVENALRFIDVARDIGCPTLRLFAGQLTQAGRETGLKRVIESLKPIAAKAEKAGIAIAMETHDDWCRGADIRAVIDGVNSPAVGVCWDVANSFFVAPMEDTFRPIAQHIRHVHFKDAAKDGSGNVVGKLPGTGTVAMEQALRLLHGAGYKGVLSFEWEKKWEPSLEEPEIAFPHFMRFTTALMRQVGVPRG